MKKISLTALLTLFLIIQASGQSVLPDVIGTTGDFFANASGQIQFTIGEVMVETYQSVNNYVTQGFHQPNYGVLTAIPSTSPLSGVSAYPNPATDNLTFDFGTATGSFTVELFDMPGSRVFSENVTIGSAGQVYILPVSRFASGVYFARVTSVTDRSQTTFKIFKSK